MGAQSLLERFDDSARGVLVRAGFEARALNHAFIDTEHLLLALTHDESSVPARALASLGLGRAELRRLVLPHDASYGGDIGCPAGFSRATVEVVELVLLGRDRVTDRALLLALAFHGGGLAGHILEENGAGPQLVAAAVERALYGLAIPERPLHALGDAE